MFFEQILVLSLRVLGNEADGGGPGIDERVYNGSTRGLSTIKKVIRIIRTFLLA